MNTAPATDPVIDVASLLQQLAGPRPPRLIDARCPPVVAGGERDAGRQAWAAGHLPGAVHADLETDLSAPVQPVGDAGRHPLPDPQRFARQLGQWGIGPDTPVVVYDANDGSMAAARLWWLLRLYGHRAVAVLDGGVAAWQAAGQTLTTAPPPVLPLPSYPGTPDMGQVVDVAEVAARVAAGQAGWLLDARAPARFAGHSEPVDPVAGHVPGALNLPYASLVAAGRLLLPAQVRARVAALGLQGAPSDWVLMCGSGVTACHLQLALAHAGLTGARVYAGSWSGWIADSVRPVATDAPVA